MIFKSTDVGARSYAKHRDAQGHFFLFATQQGTALPTRTVKRGTLRHQKVGPLAAVRSKAGILAKKPN